MGWGWLDVLTLAFILGSPVALLYLGTLAAIILLAAALLAMYYMTGEAIFEAAAQVNSEFKRIDDTLEEIQRALRDHKAIQQPLEDS
jgi:hypothetical protein